MSKGFRHLGDPNIEVGVFKPVEDREYVVNGIEAFISKDDSGPFFKEINGEMKVLLRLRCVDGEEGPAMSCSPVEFVALVNAFGGNFTDPDGKVKFTLTTTNRMSPKALMIGMKSANAAAKHLTVESKRGWVNIMSQLTPPEGKYTVKFVNAHRPDRDPNNLRFQRVANSSGSFESLIFEFEIVGDGLGNPTIWEGYRIAEFMNNPFVEQYETESGKTITAQDEGCPLWRRDERTGGIPTVVKLWMEFIHYFVPSVLRHEWCVDPTDSPFGVSEVLEPQYVIVHEAKRAANLVKVWYGQKKRSTRKGIDLRNLPMMNDAAPEEQEEVLQPNALLTLVEYIEQRWPDVVIFAQSTPDDPAVVFTEAGKIWAKEYLGGDNGPWVRAGLNLADRRLHTLNEAQLEALLAELEDQYGAIADATPW